MRIAGLYSFNRGKEFVSKRYAHLLPEVNKAIAAISAESHKVKTSKEKTMPGRMLFSPRSLNTAFDSEFLSMGWQKVRVPCDYPTTHYLPGLQNPFKKSWCFS
ncbi:MAG TPA: hypothetical protein VHZ24_08090 [Pirellulales bacterium]|jgi:hypothetical protein|nr:hypothetical protein [Pirellulales bacterium]